MILHPFEIKMVFCNVINETNAIYAHNVDFVFFVALIQTLLGMVVFGVADYYLLLAIGKVRRSGVIKKGFGCIGGVYAWSLAGQCKIILALLMH